MRFRLLTFAVLTLSLAPRLWAEETPAFLKALEPAMKMMEGRRYVQAQKQLQLLKPKYASQPLWHYLNGTATMGEVSNKMTAPQLKASFLAARAEFAQAFSLGQSQHNARAASEARSMIAKVDELLRTLNGKKSNKKSS